MVRAISAFGCCVAVLGLCLPAQAKFQVNTYTLGQENFASVAGGASGNFVVVWRSADGDSGGVSGQRFDSAGTPIGSEFQVNSATIGEQAISTLDVATDADGDFIVVWDEGVGSEARVEGRRFASTGTPIGSDFQVNTSTLLNRAYPSVASDADGDFVVVWDAPEFPDDIFARRFASDGSPVGVEFRVNTYTSGGEVWPDVAADSAGNFVVAWVNSGQDGDGLGVFAQRFASGGAMLGSEFQVNSFTVGHQGFLADYAFSLASRADGEFVVAWTDGSLGTGPGRDGAGAGVFAQRFDSSGVPLGLNFQVNSYTIRNERNPAVAFDTDGGFVVAWEVDLPGYLVHLAPGGIRLQRYDSAGVPQGLESVVDSTDFLSANFLPARPAVAAGSDGRFLVAWDGPRDDDCCSLGVFGELFTRCGNGVVDAGEDCDDGNLNDGDCCSRLCTAEPSGGTCPDDGDQCTVDECDSGGSCLHLAIAATTCLDTWEKGLLVVKEGEAGKEKVVAKFSKGPQISQMMFGDPLFPSGNAYSLCIYDQTSALVDQIDVDRAGDATCTDGTKPCWNDIGGAFFSGIGYKYKDKLATADGATVVLLKGGDAGKSKILVKGKGPNLPVGIAPALETATSVTIQLHPSSSETCFSKTLTDVKKQTSTSFKAK